MFQEYQSVFLTISTQLPSSGLIGLNIFELALDMNKHILHSLNLLTSPSGLAMMGNSEAEVHFSVISYG